MGLAAAHMHKHSWSTMSAPMAVTNSPVHAIHTATLGTGHLISVINVTSVCVCVFSVSLPYVPRYDKIDIEDHLEVS